MPFIDSCGSTLISSACENANAKRKRLNALTGLIVAPSAATATPVYIPFPNPEMTLNHNTISYCSNTVHR